MADAPCHSSCGWAPKRALSRAFVTLVCLAIGFRAGVAWSRREGVTLVSLSPDDRLRVQLVEVSTWIDRNFQIRLERLPRGTVETLFRSPDEGRPEGSERIVWSPDSRRFALLGRHFFVREGTPSRGGESLYLLCDVASGKLWCNASQAGPPFAAEDAAWAMHPDPTPQGPRP